MKRILIAALSLYAAGATAAATRFTILCGLDSPQCSYASRRLREALESPAVIMSAEGRPRCSSCASILP